jgi:DNA-binding CsgD family transcriptional regulator
VTDSPIPASELLGALAGDIIATLEKIQVAAYVVDRQRRVRWQNAISLELFGDLRGRLDSSAGLDPDDLVRVREEFARKQNGAAHSDIEVTATRADGTRVRVAVNSVALRDADGTMIGSFGLTYVLGELEPYRDGAPALSPRERQTLTLLAAGYSTAQMARELGVSKETVRNHVKGVLRRLGASSRVEAVAKGRSAGLV